MMQVKTKGHHNFIVMAIQCLLALACAGALVSAISLTAATQRFAADAFLGAAAALVGFLLTFIPSLITRYKLMPMPALLQTVYVVFVYLAMFFGEILHFYDRFAWWDSMLHFTSGIMFAMVGYLVFLALNKDTELRGKLHPACIVLFAVIFSIACGVIWEIFEFTGDCLLGMNMQRWQNNIPANEWAALQNATNLSNPGLMDTMKDFIMDTAGAVVAIPLVRHLAKRDCRAAECDGAIKKILTDTGCTAKHRKGNVGSAIPAMVVNGDEAQGHVKSYEAPEEGKLLYTITACGCDVLTAHLLRDNSRQSSGTSTQAYKLAENV